MDLVEVDIRSVRHIAIPPILKLAATLRFLSEGSYQHGVGMDFQIAMAQPTVSKVLKQVLPALAKHCNKWINLKMSEEEKQEAKKYFFNKSGFPGVVGCIDGTHIQIIRPSQDEHIYFNRKHTHSINAMMVS